MNRVDKHTIIPMGRFIQIAHGSSMFVDPSWNMLATSRHQSHRSQGPRGGEGGETMSIEIIIKHEEKPTRVFESIPLTESALCVDCDCVMRLDKNGRCSVCGSDSVLPLWGAMNRPASGGNDA